MGSRDLTDQRDIAYFTIASIPSGFSYFILFIVNACVFHSLIVAM